MKNIEKKEYVNPSMDVVEINAPQIMTVSAPILSSDDWNSSDGDPI